MPTRWANQLGRLLGQPAARTAQEKGGLALAYQPASNISSRLKEEQWPYMGNTWKDTLLAKRLPF